MCVSDQRIYHKSWDFTHTHWHSTSIILVRRVGPTRTRTTDAQRATDLTCTQKQTTTQKKHAIGAKTHAASFQWETVAVTCGAWARSICTTALTPDIYIVKNGCRHDVREPFSLPCLRVPTFCLKREKLQQARRLSAGTAVRLFCAWRTGVRRDAFGRAAHTTTVATSDGASGCSTSARGGANCSVFSGVGINTSCIE